MSAQACPICGHPLTTAYCSDECAFEDGWRAAEAYWARRLRLTSTDLARAAQTLEDAGYLDAAAAGALCATAQAAAIRIDAMAQIAALRSRLDTSAQPCAKAQIHKESRDE